MRSSLAALKLLPNTILRQIYAGPKITGKASRKLADLFKLCPQGLTGSEMQNPNPHLSIRSMLAFQVFYSTLFLPFPVADAHMLKF